jgi:hypothetical protein
MRGPGVAVGVLGQSVGDGDVAADVEQRLIREVQEGCEADGFQV